MVKYFKIRLFVIIPLFSFVLVKKNYRGVTSVRPPPQKKKSEEGQKLATPFSILRDELKTVKISYKSLKIILLKTEKD